MKPPSRPLFRVLCPYVVLFAALAVPHVSRAAGLDPDNPPPEATQKEIQEGNKASAEFEKSQAKKLMDPKSSPEAQALSDKLNAMIKRLGAASARPKINYSIKVVEDDDVNAFTLPNGHIYVYRGLLKFAASDDELAAVFAHEIGHNVRMHALRGDKKAKKLSLAGLAAMALAIAGGRAGANIAQFSNLMLIGVLNGYTVGYEKEADAQAIQILIKAGYNPSAMVTFMERQKLQEQRQPDIQLGIFQTHPASIERADAALGDIRKAGLEYTPRAVNGAQEVIVTEKPDRYLVGFDDLTLLEFSRTDPKAKTRADNAAARVESMLKDDLRMHEISTTPDGRLLGRGQEIAAATGAEATLAKSTPQAVADGWSKNFSRLFWRESLNGKM